MRNPLFASFCLLCLFCLVLAPAAVAQKKKQPAQVAPMQPAQFGTPLAAHVDPLIGTDRGHSIPGVCLPFGLLRLSPDVEVPNVTNGYLSTKKIVGFSHTHVSGTGGGGRYGNILVSPQAQAPRHLDSLAATGKADEHAAPGYYAVTLKQGADQVKCELTGTERAGIHRYTFLPGWKRTAAPHIVVDAAWVVKRLTGDPDKSPRCLGGELRVVNDSTLEGFGHFAGGWGPDRPYFVYFSLVADRPFAATLHQGNQPQAGQNISGKSNRAVLKFDPASAALELRVGISMFSLENARLHRQQVAGRAFEQIRLRAQAQWENILQTVQVQGGSLEQRKLFYSALYRSFLLPTDLTNDSKFAGKDVDYFDDHYTMWDTFRTLFPLYTLIAPEKMRAILRGMLVVYDQTGWIPDAWIAGGHGQMQGGSNADVVVADAVVKKLGGFDVEKAYQAIRKNGTVVSDRPDEYGRFLAHYLEKGYVNTEARTGSGSRTLEYTYNDFCIGQVAKALGKQADYRLFDQRSYNAFQLYRFDDHCFWVKDRQGDWAPNFSPDFLANPIWEGPFYEGSPIQYSFSTPHLFDSLIALRGGREQYAAFLDTYFQAGRHKHSNEPEFLAPFAYHFAGRPDRATDQVHHIAQTDYQIGFSGLPGDDDAGAMSSWYVWASVGLYPVAGRPIYLITTPLFETSQLQLAGGKALLIRTKGFGGSNRYIVGATLDGKPLDRAWLWHDEIAKGAVLELTLASQPANWGTSQTPPRE